MSDEVPSDRLSKIIDSLTNLKLEHQSQSQSVSQCQQVRKQPENQQDKQQQLQLNLLHIQNQISPHSPLQQPVRQQRRERSTSSSPSGRTTSRKKTLADELHRLTPNSVPKQATPTFLSQLPCSGYYTRYNKSSDTAGYFLPSGTQTIPSATSQTYHHYLLPSHCYQHYLLQQQNRFPYQQRQQQQQSALPPLQFSPLLGKQATSFSGNIPLGIITETQTKTNALTLAQARYPQVAADCSPSTPNSPRLVPRREQRASPISLKSNAAEIVENTNANTTTEPAAAVCTTSSSILAAQVNLTSTSALSTVLNVIDSPWTHFSAFTEHLNVQQLDNYSQAVPEINWQERCLELQLELHRSKNQAGRIRDMLREKLSELEQRAVDAEERAEEAEDKVRAMEQRLSEWQKPATSNSSSIHQNQQQQSQTQTFQTQNLLQSQQTHANNLSYSVADSQQQQQSISLSSPDTQHTLTALEIQVEEQRQLRLHDARQVEAKAARIKEWVTNKLRELEEQNQVLREQNLKCNQQLELLRNHIANQTNRSSSIGAHAVHNSLSLEVQDFSENSESRRHSGSLDPQDITSHPLTSSYPHHQHRRNLSMEPHEIERNLLAAVDDLTLLPLSSLSQTISATRPDSSDTDTGHDYAEIYTPSHERLPNWLKNISALSGSGGSIAATTISGLRVPRPPTPPLHRFPSWEAKIYQVANDGLTETKNANEISTGRQPQYSGVAARDNPETSNGAVSLRTNSISNTIANGGLDQSTPASQIANGTLESSVGVGGSIDGTTGTSCSTTCTQKNASGGFCDMSIPVYATVKGRASQIRSIPFTGDSSDDSSDGEEHAVTLAHNSHNSTCPESTDTSTSGSASSPSKSLKTSSSLTESPAKRSDSESPENNKSRGLSDDYAMPPDAVSEATCMDISMPSLLMHQSLVDLPSRKVESLEKTGHLAKLGGKLKTWRKRWFVLRNGTLSYWKTQHDIDRKPQGQILLDEVCRINRAEGASTFEIDTGKKVYYLTAESNATMDDWIRVLQNVQRRNATKLLLSRDDQKPTVQGWVTKVKNGHAKKSWCILLGKTFLYFKVPGENNPLGQINMRDARVEEVEHISDSDSEDREDPSQSQSRLTVAIYPAHQGPTYLILPCKQERDNWLYHLTVVSCGRPNAGTQYEQLVQKLMETGGDSNCVLWKHPILLHSKEAPSSPLSSLQSESMHSEAIKLFKSCQLFMSVAVNQPGIDYHVVLAQNSLQHSLNMPELQTEMICILIKQTSRHTGQKLSVGVQVNNKLGKQTRASGLPPINDCKSNPPAYSFVQGWQLLSLAVSLFVPKSSRLLWYLKLHLARNADSKTETGKYAAYCERALERTLSNGGRESQPSRMEVLSILMKNPYHHSLPHAIPVHLMNGTYQVISFDGSSTIEEFQTTLALEIGARDFTNGFCLFSDDPIEKDLEHYLDPLAKLCDVISKWETALREKGSGKFENSRVIQLTYKSRLYWKHAIKFETDKERLLLCYQINHQIVQGRFPLSRDLALELASLMTQIDMGDYAHEKSRGSGNIDVGLQALGKFYPYRYRDALSSEQLKNIQDLLISKWMVLKGRSMLDCVRIYLTCCRKWPFFGAALFQAKPRHSDQAMAWLAVSEDALNVLELSSMTLVARYPYTSVITFGGCQDDFMLVVTNDEATKILGTGALEQKLLFAMSKPKILEITLLIADYMNALGQTLPGTPKINSLTRNGSHRSLRSRPGTMGRDATGTLGVSPNVTSTANNTLNSHATHTHNSTHSHTLNTSHHSAANGVGAGGIYGGNMGSSHGGHQPDILKSIPDHQVIIK